MKFSQQEMIDLLKLKIKNKDITDDEGYQDIMFFTQIIDNLKYSLHLEKEIKSLKYSLRFSKEKCKQLHGNVRPMSLMTKENLVISIVNALEKEDKKMPYIKPKDRKKFDLEINKLVRNIVCDGDLNYVITRIAHGILERSGTSYTVLNAIIGVFECAKLEFYRRLVSPYEDIKIQENGDIV